MIAEEQTILFYEHSNILKKKNTVHSLKLIFLLCLWTSRPVIYKKIKIKNYLYEVYDVAIEKLPLVYQRYQFFEIRLAETLICDKIIDKFSLEKERHYIKFIRYVFYT